jgi:hypothetical protein
VGLKYGTWMEAQEMRFCFAISFFVSAYHIQINLSRSRFEPISKTYMILCGFVAFYIARNTIVVTQGISKTQDRDKAS